MTSRVLKRKIHLFGKEYEREQITTALVLLIPVVISIIMLFIVPVIQVVYYSFTNFSIAKGNGSFNLLLNARRAALRSLGQFPDHWVEVRH